MKRTRVAAASRATSRLRPVVFDLDGVLVDSEPLYEAAFRSYVSGAGRPELADWFPNTLGRRQVDYLPELAPRVGQSCEDVAAGLDGALARALAGADLAPMSSASEAVREIASGGRIVGLASSSSRPFVEHALDTLGLTASFAELATGDEVDRGKPEPELYLLAASRLGVTPAACIAVEDTPAGIAAAVAAGMTAIAVPNQLTAQMDLSLANCIVSDLSQAVEVVRFLDGHRSSASKPDDDAFVRAEREG